MEFNIKGNIVDVFKEVIYPGTIYVENGVITKITPEKNSKYSNYILPGFIDSHVHIESSMLTPSEFAKNAVKFGTVATVSDPHEIANVCGISGIKFMIDDAEQVPFKFFFGAPSCVPATNMETSGASISSTDIDIIFKTFPISYLSEVMNYPGVVNEEADIIEKIKIAKKFEFPIDGHCPNLSGDNLKKYISFGITTDHECTSLSEALEKIQNGMKILIREGSAAKNFDELIPLLDKHPDYVMFCTDDLHPYDLLNGHINLLVKRANDYGYNLFKILRAVTLNPVLHYKLPVGLLRVGDDADFIVVKDLKDFEVIQTYIKGQLVYKEGRTLIEINKPSKINNFNCSFREPSDFNVPADGKSKIRVIEVIDGELLTNEYITEAKIFDGLAIADIENDILKVAVVNRYKDFKPSVGFVKNFGLKNGALATSVAHDSHNIIVIGTTDELIARAVNLIIKNKGGIAFVDGTCQWSLPLPIGGLMTDDTLENVSAKYQEIEDKVKANGTNLKSPLMTITFMSLLVIPHLKIGDKGLFNVDKFQFVDIFID